jgi:peptide subunit release factor RF-3
MADDKETVNHAVAGDIIGLYDTGNDVSSYCMVNSFFIVSHK